MLGGGLLVEGEEGDGGDSDSNFNVTVLPVGVLAGDILVED